MGVFQGLRRYRLPWFVALASLSALLAACGDSVSEEELAAAQSDLQAAESKVESLEGRIQELQTEVTGGIVTDIGVLLSINELIEFKPTVVELKPTSAAVQMITKEPVLCSITYGRTADYGQLSTDDNMAPSGHTDHYHTLRDLQPDTVHHYKWALFGPHGDGL